MLIRRSIFVILVAALLMAGCAPATVVTETVDPNQIKDMVATNVALTISAQASEMAAQATPTSVPTETLAPSPTPIPPTETPVTEVPTLIVIPTATNTPIIPPGGGGGLPLPTTSPYQCQWVSQSPLDWTVLKPGDDFDMTWKIKNTGVKIWEKTDIDFMYLRGDEMQTYFDAIDLPGTVEVGKTIDLVIDMRAPKTTGVHTTTWALKGQDTFCLLTISIIVEK